MRTRRYAMAALSAWLLAAAGLAGTQEVRDPNGAFAVSLPADWKVRVTGHALKFVNADAPGGAARFSAWSEALELGPVTLKEFVDGEVASLKRLIRSWTVVQRQAVQVSGMAGVHIRAASSPGDNRLVGDYYFAVTRKHKLRLQVLCPAGQHAQMQPAVQAAVASWRIAGAAPAPPPKLEPTPTPVPTPMPPPTPPPTPVPTPTPPTPAERRQVDDPNGAFTVSVPGDWFARVDRGGVTAFSLATAAQARAKSAARRQRGLRTWVGEHVTGLKQQHAEFAELGREPLQLGIHEGLLVRWRGGPAGADRVTECGFVLTATHQITLGVSCPQDKHAALKPTLKAVFSRWKIRGERVPLTSEPTPPVTPPPVPTPTPTPPPAPPRPVAGMTRLEDPNGVYSIDVPAHWQTTRHAGGFVAAAPGGGANVTVRSMARQAKSLRDLASRLTAQWKKNAAFWRETKRRAERRSGTEALHISATTVAKGAAPDATQGAEYYLALSARHEVLLTFGGAAAEQHAMAPTFRAILDTWYIRQDVAKAPPTPMPFPMPMPFPKPTPTPTPVPTPMPRPTPAAMQAVTDPGGTFSLSVPAGWQVQRQTGGAAAASPDGRANAAARGGAKAAMTFQQWVYGVVAQFQQQMPGWTEVSRTPIRLAGSEAVLIRAKTLTQGIEMHADTLLVHAGAHQAMLSLNCRRADFAGLEPTFRQIVGSFRVPAQGGAGPLTPVAPATKLVSHRSRAFSLTVPATWAIAHQATGVTGTDPTRQANLMIVVGARRSQTAQQLAQTTAAMLRTQVPNWQQTASQRVEVSRYPAVRLTATAAPGGVAHHGEYLLVLAETQQVIVMLSCPQAQQAQWAPVFQQIVQSVQVR